MRIKLIARLLVAVLGAGSAAVAFGPTAAYADSKVGLGIDSLWQMVVEPAHGHLFFSTGESGPAVRVTDLSGGSQKTIPLPDSRGMALSPDSSTLYVALHGENAIATIDTATLTETRRYSLGSNTCPVWVAPAGGKLYIGYGCQYDRGMLGSLDLREEAPVMATHLLGPSRYYYYPPLIRSSAANPNLLVTAERTSITFSLASDLTVYDVSSGVPVEVASLPWDVCLGLHDVVLTPDASKVILSCSYFDGRSVIAEHHPAYSTTDLSPAGVYPAVRWTVAATTSPDGSFVIGANSGGQPATIYAERRDGSLVHRYELPNDTYVARQGLAVSPDGGTLYAVIGGDKAEGFTLHLLTDYTKTGTVLEVSAPPSSPAGSILTISGKLSFHDGTVPSPQTLRVSRKDGKGTHSLPDVRTAVDGSFAFSDTPVIGGANTYTVTFPGDETQATSSRSATVQLSRVVPALGIATNASTYTYGQTATVTAQLGTTHDNRDVCIYAERYGSARTTVKCGTVDTSGKLSATYPMYQRTTFIASFGGDYQYSPASVSRVAYANAKVSGNLSGYYTTSGSYKVYRSTVKPVLGVTVVPASPGTCVYLTVQKVSAGVWKTLGTSGCHKLSSAGKVTYTYAGSRSTGVGYRVQAKFNGTTANTVTYSSWQNFKFTS